METRLPSKKVRINGFVIWLMCSEYGRYSHHLPREDECFLGRQGEPCEGGWNNLPGVSGHWRGSECSGVLQGISSITGGWSSLGMREVEAASSGSRLTSLAASGNAACGGVFTGSVSLRLLLCKSEIASRGELVIYRFLFIAR